MTPSQDPKKPVKGEYGYLRRKRFTITLWTLLLFAIPLSLYAAGIITTGSNKNLLTIVAILGCLPACKSTVNLIMYFRATGCSEPVRASIEPISTGLFQLYDLYFTSYQKNYPVSHMTVCGKLIIGYAEQKTVSASDCEKHLETLLKQGGLKKIHVKIYQDLESYCEGLKKLSSEAERGTEEETQAMISGILAISL